MNGKSFRSKPVGWRGESHRHYLASKGIKTRKKYYYTPTYVAGDLAPIAVDGVATVGASAVSLIPVAVPALLLYGGAKAVSKRKKEREKQGKGFFVKKENLPELPKQKFEGYVGNIQEDTLSNNSYRKVLFTGKHSQLVVQTVKPGEEIENEIHPDNDQFIRVEEGTAEFILGNGTKKYVGGDGSTVLVPAGTWHHVLNKGKSDLKIYTIYSPKNEPLNKGILDKRMKDAIARENKN